MISHHTPTTTHSPLVLAKLDNVSAEMCEDHMSPHETGEIWSHFHLINQLISPGQNDRHFADDIFWYIFVNENLCILIEISLKIVPT